MAWDTQCSSTRRRVAVDSRVHNYCFRLQPTQVIVADVGSLREEIIEGETGFLSKKDPSDLARAIRK
jgi:hypothetical protein